MLPTSEEYDFRKHPPAYRATVQGTEQRGRKQRYCTVVAIGGECFAQCRGSMMYRRPAHHSNFDPPFPRLLLFLDMLVLMAARSPCCHQWRCASYVLSHRSCSTLGVVC